MEAPNFSRIGRPKKMLKLALKGPNLIILEEGMFCNVRIPNFKFIKIPCDEKMDL